METLDVKILGYSIYPCIPLYNINSINKNFKEEVLSNHLDNMLAIKDAVYSEKILNELSKYLDVNETDATKLTNVADELPDGTSTISFYIWVPKTRTILVVKYFDNEFINNYFFTDPDDIIDLGKIFTDIVGEHVTIKGLGNKAFKDACHCSTITDATLEIEDNDDEYEDEEEGCIKFIDGVQHKRSVFYIEMDSGDCYSYRIVGKHNFKTANEAQKFIESELNKYVTLEMSNDIEHTDIRSDLDEMINLCFKD